MKTICSIFYQYRDLNYTYTFKQKELGTVMKVSDLAANQFKKIALSQENWKKLGIPFEKGDKELIPWLIEQGYVPSRTAENGFEKPAATALSEEEISACVHSLFPDHQVPNFDLFKKEDPTFADPLIALGNKFEQIEAYDSALIQYTLALAFTKTWKNYQHFPPLFEKMGQNIKAAIAYLFLAQYQWLADPASACKCLENAVRLSPGQLKLLSLLARAYGAAGNREGERATLLQIGQWHEREKRDGEAVNAYRSILQQNQGCLEAYERMIPLISNPQERAHFYLMKALFHLRKEEKAAAEESCKKALSLLSSAPFEQFYPFLLLFTESVDPETFASIFSEIKPGPPYNQWAKFGISFLEEKQLDINPQPLYDTLIENYENLNKLQKALRFSMIRLNQLVAQQEWKEAEAAALAALKYSSDPLPIFQTLEQIYSHWEGHKLSPLWIQLGQCHERRGELEAAAATYRKAYERFNGEEHLLALGEVLVKQEKVEEAVELYSQKAFQALTEGGLAVTYVERIRKIDPRMTRLPEKKRFTLLALSKIAQLSKQRSELSQRVVEFSQRVEQTIDGPNIEGLPRVNSNQTLINLKTPISSISNLGQDSFAVISADGMVRTWVDEQGTYKLANTRPVDQPKLYRVNDSYSLSVEPNQLQLWRIGNYGKTHFTNLDQQKLFCPLPQGPLATVDKVKTDTISIWGMNHHFCFIGTLTASDREEGKLSWLLKDEMAEIVDIFYMQDSLVSVSKKGVMCRWPWDTIILLYDRRNDSPNPGIKLVEDENVKIENIVEVSKWKMAFTVGNKIRTCGVGSRECKDIEGHSGKITDLIHLSGVSFASLAEGDHTIKIWDLESGKLSHTIQLDAACTKLISSPHLICGLANGKILLLKGFKPVNLLQEHQTAITALLFQNGHLISGSLDGTLKIWPLNI